MTADHWVVVNAAGQYSVWPADREPPAGWRTIGVSGSRRECLDHVAGIWIDPRPVPGGPAGPCVPDLVARAAERSPDAVAVECGDESVTFRQLLADADRLARRLRAEGVGPESTVAVLLNRSVDLVVALLGVWRCGASYVPLDPALPARRIADMAVDAAVKVAVTSPRHADRVAGMAVVDLADLDDDRSDQSVVDDADPDAVAYTIFTSGSTGRPKGVRVTHRSLANHIAWAVAELAEAGSGGAPVFSSVAFDLVVPNIWAPLAAGQRLWLHDGDLDDLGAALTAAGPFSFLKLTPGHLEIIGGQLDDAAVAGLAKRVVVAGEALPGSLVRRWRRLLGDSAVLNEYGPTEATVGTCVFPVDTDIDGVVPIGHPLPNMLMRILDERLAPVAAATVGELYVGGVGVAVGYAGRPELTADRFVPDPYGAPGTRLYRTGDLARSRPDGAVEFAGRVDDQVKINGYRVEPGDVRAALLGHAEVTDAAVVADGGRLVAYVVGRTVGLRDWLRESLPDYLVPGVIVAVEAIPLTANGKVDRRALPDPGMAPHAAPRTAQEREIAEIWAEVLGFGPVGRDVDFTELGGTSLHATRVIARLRARHGADLTLRDLFGAATVAALAALLDHRRNTSPLPPVPTAPAGNLEPSAHQQRLWFLDHLSAAAGRAYNVPALTRIRGSLDVPALRAAIRDVAMAHEQLRTSFHLVDGTLTARVDTVSPRLREVDLRDHVAPEREALRQAAEFVADHVDLGTAPLVGCIVYRVDTDGYLLAVRYHHLAVDGWSLDVLDRHLAAAYRARAAGGVADLPTPRLAYRDFAAWQRALPDAVCTDLIDRRCGHLAGAPAVLNLPADHTRPPVPPYRGCRISRRTAPRSLGAIRELAVATRTTPYAICLAALGVLLRELTSRQDALVASPSAGRPAPELEDVVGFFANTVVVRVRPGAGTFRDLVLATHEAALDAIEDEYLPFERLAARLAPRGDLSRSPLAQVALAYQGRRRPHCALPGLTAEPLAADTGSAKFDLAVELHETGDELAVTVEYRTDLFEPERAAAMADRYVDLLHATVEDPERPIADLVADRADGRCLHEIFAATAARWPDRVAVTDGTDQLTYAELDRAANRLAHRLRRVGAGPERHVGLCADRTVRLAVGVLAILKAGAGYLPLDPRHPPARLVATLSDADSPILLGDERLCAPFAGDRAFVPLADPRDEPDTPPDPGTRPDNVAYVIYTSGSTGTPKGVVVTHANATRLFTATDEEFGFGHEDVWTLFHSIAFDFSVWELWGALLHGGRLVVVPHLTSRDPSAFLRLLRDERVTVLNQTPTAFRQLAAAAAAADFPRLDLRAVVFGGEALDATALRDWVAGYGTVRPHLVNMYGITETTVHVTIRPVEVADLAAGTAVPIGRPIQDLRVHILDENMAQQPPGAVGELYVGGAGVARGYLNRPELTAERFVRDPFGGVGERLYRTGDLAVRRADGDLEFRGRADTQVKLHGFRIELGEIERALLDQQGVRAAACVLREDVPGEPRLVAYLVPGEGAVPTTEVRAALADRLPEHMVPAFVVELAEFPMSTNGKLDREQLPPPSTQDRVRVAPRVPAHTPTERILAEAWSAVLGVDEPDVHDNFFTVGGDSIVAIRFGAAARAAGLPVTIERIFRHPTIAGLATACAESTAEPVGPAEPSTTLSDVDGTRLPAGVVDGYPTSAMQLGILYECELADDDTELYHDLISVRVGGRLDVAALERALAAVSARHELLRTSFDLGRFREPMQFVHETAVVPLTVAPGEFDAETAEARLWEWWRQDKAAPFDLSRPPLVRCHVIAHSTETFELALSVHHVAFDGWSLARLAADIVLDYDVLLRGEAGDRVEPPARYRDFVVAEQAATADPGAERFWRDRLAASVASPLPTLPGGDPHVDHAYLDSIPSEVDERLRDVAGELGIPRKSLYLAAHARALRVLTGSSEVVTGMQMHGRLEEPGADQVLGLFLNIVPLHLSVGGSWVGLASAAFEAERAIQPHRRYPLSRIQRLAGPGREPFDVVFNYTDFHLFADLDRLTAVRPLGWRLSDRHSFPLMTEISRSPQAGTRVLKTSTSAGSPFAGTAARLGELVRRGIEGIAADPYDEVR